MIAEFLNMFTSTLSAMWMAAGIKEVQMGFGMFLGLVIMIMVIKHDAVYTEGVNDGK